MRLTDYSSVLRGVAALMGVPWSQLQQEDADTIRNFADKRLAVAWESELWPETLRCQERAYRNDYDADTEYLVGDEVYYPPEGKYYQALRTTEGNLPTVEDYWVETDTTYSSADWATATAYVVGDIVKYAVNGYYYACHTAHTSSASLFPTATDADERWARLQEFDRYIALDQLGQTLIGEVLEVYDRNPYTSTRAKALSWELSSNGIQVYHTSQGRVWVYFRRQRERLTGDTYSATTTYNLGDQVYYESGGVGNFYESLIDSNTGISPLEGDGSWDLVEIPYIFENYLIRGAYADYLAADGQHDKAVGAAQIAEQFLIMESDKLTRLQGQVRRPRVSTY